MSTLEQRLQGTRTSLFLRELFTNSAHFPLINILLELLINGPRDYLLELDPYILLAAMLVQAWFISSWQYQNKIKPLIGNLIGPAVYTFAEISLEGGQFFTANNHLLYWAFAFGIGLLQQLQHHLPSRTMLLTIAEGLTRTSIPLVMYMVLEFRLDDYASFAEFLQDPPHMFIVLVIPFLGMIVGSANANHKLALTTLQSTAQQLRQYSEWLLGRELLSKAVSDPHSLSLSRHRRGIVFTDIRGFTAWSEGREPEEVVTMVNAYYEAAEEVWHKMQAIKVKLTADEIMLVFADARQAVDAARSLHKAIDPLLHQYGLSAGTGVHTGEVVEGLMGGRERKSYDLLGDSVNTAKRLCDNANGDEILLSQESYEAMNNTLPVGEPRLLPLKGKREPHTAYPLAL